MVRGGSINTNTLHNHNEVSTTTTMSTTMSTTMRGGDDTSSSTPKTPTSTKPIRYAAYGSELAEGETE